VQILSSLLAAFRSCDLVLVWVKDAVTAGQSSPRDVVSVVARRRTQEMRLPTRTRPVVILITCNAIDNLFLQREASRTPSVLLAQ